MKCRCFFIVTLFYFSREKQKRGFYGAQPQVHPPFGVRARLQPRQAAGENRQSARSNSRGSILLKLKYLLPRYRGRQRTGFRRTTGIPSITRYSGRHRAGSGGQLPREHSSKIKISSSPLSSPDTAEGTECCSGGQLLREHTYVDEARSAKSEYVTEDAARISGAMCLPPQKGKASRPSAQPLRRRYAPSRRVGICRPRSRSGGAMRLPPPHQSGRLTYKVL